MNIRELVVRAVDVPMRRPLVTSARTIDLAPLLLLDLYLDDDVIGHAYLFCFDSLAQRLLRETLVDIGGIIAGLPLNATQIGLLLDRRFRLVGARGLTGMALAGIDVVIWDALSQAAGLSLAQYLEVDPIPIPAYNSNGLGLMGNRGVALEAEELVAEGFNSIKLRLGYDTIERDLEAVHWVRTAVGPDIEILVDYNQALYPAEAMRRCHALDHLGLGWIEEPIVHDDLVSCGRLTRATATPIQIGENFMGPYAARQALEAQASNLVMFDLQRIGGITGWLIAAKHAERAAVPASSHLFPEVSVHLLSATPTHDRLEVVDWASPILAEPLVVRDGFATPSDTPGTGVSWDEAAVAKYLRVESRVSSPRLLLRSRREHDDTRSDDDRSAAACDAFSPTSRPTRRGIPSLPRSPAICRRVLGSQSEWFPRVAEGWHSSRSPICRRTSCSSNGSAHLLNRVGIFDGSPPIRVNGAGRRNDRPLRRARRSADIDSVLGLRAQKHRARLRLVRRRTDKALEGAAFDARSDRSRRSRARKTSAAAFRTSRRHR